MTHSYRFISEHRDPFGVARLCRILRVRRPGFYEWLAAAPARAQRDSAVELLAAEIAEVYVGHQGTCGRPGIVATEARGFTDVYTLVRRCDKDLLLARAAEVDMGFWFRRAR